MQRAYVRTNHVPWLSFNVCEPLWAKISWFCEFLLVSFTPQNPTFLYSLLLQASHNPNLMFGCRLHLFPSVAGWYQSVQAIYLFALPNQVVQSLIQFLVSSKTEFSQVHSAFLSFSELLLSCVIYFSMSNHDQNHLHIYCFQ